MKIKSNYFVLLLLIGSALFYSCSSSDTDEVDEDFNKELVIVVDTVVVRTDTIKTELKKVGAIKLNLTVQIGAFVNQDNATQYVSDARGKLNTMVDMNLKGGVYKITVGKFDNSERADAYLQFVKSNGYEDAFISNAD